MMDSQSIKLEQSKLMQDYRDRKESIYKHFYYDPFQINNYKSRQDYLTNQTYQRESLVNILKTQNQKWGMNDLVEQHIDTLLDPNASVVIGGQQTGLLTGPLYTIHKIVSIIIQAKEQREYLQQPVIPVFWMAGEDHDLLEVDHVYTLGENELHKTRVNDQTPFDVKLPLSKRELPKDTESFVDEVFSSFQETEHTKSVYELVKQAMLASDTYVDFFACCIQQLFQEEGLVLVDAADDELRRLEKDYFIQMVDYQEEIATSVVSRLQELSKDDYHVSLDVTSSDAHLFYHHDGERLLLEVDDSGYFVSKGEEVRFTKESLKETIEAFPERFSNNVVTRPLMQESVFPVLSFVGGPGEIAYWAALKDAFTTLGLRLPIVMPRLSLTLMKRNHQTLINDYQINVTDLINEGTYQDKMNWLKRQTQSPIDETVQEVKKQFTQDHQPLRELAASMSSDLHDLTQTNLEQIQEQIDYIEKRLMQSVKEKNQIAVNHFDTLDLFYRPEGGLQERIWNITYWLNEYGLSLPQKLTNLPPRWEQDHQLVYL